MNAKLHELIENQRKGHENQPRWMIDEIRKTDPETADKLSAALKAFGSSL